MSAFEPEEDGTDYGAERFEPAQEEHEHVLEWVPIPKCLLITAATAEESRTAACGMSISGPTGVHPLLLLVLNHHAQMLQQRVYAQVLREHPDHPDAAAIHRLLAQLDRAVAALAADIIGTEPE